MKHPMKPVFFASAFAALLAAGGAQAATQIHVRGSIKKIDGLVLTVDTREGKTVEIHLAPDYKVAQVVKKSIADIKPGVYVGTAALPQSDGTLRAIEVTIFPPAQKGAGEGFRPHYDLTPDSTMTNATVASDVKDVEGRILTLTYKGGTKKVIVPTKAPIVSYRPAAHADVKPGIAVSINAEESADGSLKANRFNIAGDGLAPPN